MKASYLIQLALIAPIATWSKRWTEKDYDENFFNMKSWSEDKKDEIFDKLLAVKEIGGNFIVERSEVKSGRAKSRGVRRNRRLEEQGPDDLGLVSSDAAVSETSAVEGQVIPLVAMDAHTSGYYHRGKKGKSSKSGTGKSGKKSKSGSGSDDRDECPDPESRTLPCPDPHLKYVCDKYNMEMGDFLDCFEMCKESFCCVHDSRSRRVAPSCSQTEDNCSVYSPCYIIWWKLSDTVGPAPFFYASQRGDDFYPEFDDVIDTFDDEFINQLLGHHFDDDVVNETRFVDPNEW